MRKIASVIVIAALLITSAMPVFGSTASDATELERVIRQVRAVIDIPTDLTVFEHSSWDDSEGVSWHLSWRNDDWSASYSVSVSDGVITSFWSHRNQDDQTGLATLSRAQGQRLAENFLGRVLPSGIDDVRLLSSSSSVQSFSYSFVVYVNNFPVNDWTMSVTVDKFTERVAGFSANHFGFIVDEFSVPDEILSREDAVSAFLENNGVLLVYSSFFDFMNRETRIFPAYLVNSSRFIDAESGEPVVAVWGAGVVGPGGAGGAMIAAPDAVDVELTPGERAAVDNLAGTITREQAIRTATSAVPGLAASAVPQHASLSQRWDDHTRHIWHLSFENFSVTIDANDNRLLSFFNFGQRDIGDRNVSVEVAERTAREFAERVAAREMEQSELMDDLRTIDIRPLALEQGAMYNFTFVRQVYEIPFPGNSITVSVDPATGDIMRFELSWNAGFEFPALIEGISLEEAFEVYADTLDFELFYVRNQDGDMTLVYGFRGWVNFLVDPVDGARLGHDGNPFIDQAIVTSYDDIAGRWYENTVLALLDNGYFIPGTSFNGGAVITQEEFLRFLYSPWGMTSNRDDFYQWMVSMGIILSGEIAPDSAISRQDVARSAIRSMNLQRAAQDESIFINPFYDGVASGFLGYAALARALGIMQGDPNGNFNGSASLTRAEAAVVILNLLRAR
jgi:hypothetical protein